MAKRIRVLFLGYGCLGLGILQGLLASDDCEVVGVFRWSSRPKSKGFVDAYERLFQETIARHGLREVSCEGVNAFEFTRILEELKPDYLLFGSWGEIVKPHLLTREDFRVINCHPSLLPAHRGPNPYASAIRSGASKSGVTFHYMTEAVDGGPILLQQAIPIEPIDTGGRLRAKCAMAAREIAPELVRMLKSRKNLKGTPQESAGATYFPAIKLEEGNIQWDWNPVDIANQVRGLQPWLDSFSFLPTPLGKRTMIAVRKVSVLESPSSEKASAGTIIAYKDNQLHIASANPTQRLVIDDFSIFAWIIYLPRTLSRWLGRVVFKPGVRFDTTLP